MTSRKYSLEHRRISTLHRPNQGRKDPTTGGKKQPLKVVTECNLKNSFFSEYNVIIIFMRWLRK